MQRFSLFGGFHSRILSSSKLPTSPLYCPLYIFHVPRLESIEFRKFYLIRFYILGLTVADLVFPWFIFIMGSSIFISCRSLKRKRVSKLIISKKIVIRSIKLFLLGLFLNNGKFSIFIFPLFF